MVRNPFGKYQNSYICLFLGLIYWEYLSHPVTLICLLKVKYAYFYSPLYIFWVELRPLIVIGIIEMYILIHIILIILWSLFGCLLMNSSGFVNLPLRPLKYVHLSFVSSSLQYEVLLLVDFVKLVY